MLALGYFSYPCSHITNYIITATTTTTTTMGSPLHAWRGSSFIFQRHAPHDTPPKGYKGWVGLGVGRV